MSVSINFSNAVSLPAIQRAGLKIVQNLLVWHHLPVGVNEEHPQIFPRYVLWLLLNDRCVRLCVNKPVYLPFFKSELQ